MYIYTMKRSEAKQIVTKLLTDAGYQISGDNITAPEAQSPLDAISIQDQLSDIVFEGDNVFQLQYVGDRLSLVEVEI